MSHISRVIEGLKPALVMVLVQVAYGGLGILFKMAANDGNSLSVIMAYRSLVASAFIVPLAYFFERWHLPSELTSFLQYMSVVYSFEANK